jgi:hypothetical protein
MRGIISMRPLASFLAVFAACLSPQDLATANVGENLDQLTRRYARGPRDQTEHEGGVTEVWFTRGNVAVKVLMIGGAASEEIFFNANQEEIAAIRNSYGEVWKEPGRNSNTWVSKDGLEATTTLSQGPPASTYQFTVSDQRASLTLRLAREIRDIEKYKTVWKPTHPRYIAIQKDIANLEAKLSTAREAARARK